MTDTPDVWGFFYGGLINPEVMARVGMSPTGREVATLPGRDITISPLVNLVPDPTGIVFGLLLRLTHAELSDVYGQLKATYLPEAVLTYTLDGQARPALCYVVPRMSPGQAEAAHVQPLIDAARELEFPDWYQAKLRSFLPSSS